MQNGTAAKERNKEVPQDLKLKNKRSNNPVVPCVGIYPGGPKPGPQRHVSSVTFAAAVRTTAKELPQGPLMDEWVKKM